jgi:hypothetical protein
VHKLVVVVGGHLGGITVEVDALDCGVTVVDSTEDHVDLGRCRRFLVGHVVEFQVIAIDELE